MFQSTHPHGVRLSECDRERCQWSFNPRTHTGCDYLWLTKIYLCPNVSIHAPTRGATYRHLRRQRGDPVSIHAPTRGATLPDIIVITRGVVSIHAPTRGATIIGPQFGSGFDVSIHAPTRGATGRYSVSYLIIASFNPRTHTGCDTNDKGEYTIKQVSIHAPTRGATIPGMEYDGTNWVSIHAPTRGATVVGHGDSRVLYPFQSTHPHGVRHHIYF